MRRFAFVAPNYHPRTCGVGDFSARFAAELQRLGHETAIFTPQPVARHPDMPGVSAHGVDGRLPITIAHNAIAAVRAFRPTDVLIQYTPQMWDASRFGTPAPTWLARSLRSPGTKVTLIAHELFIPFEPRPDLVLGATSQRLLLAALLESVDRAFVTTGTRASSLLEMCRLLGVPLPGVVRVGANALPTAQAAPRGGARCGVFSTPAVGKRFDVVLDAFELISQRRADAELVLIGDLGPPTRPIVRRIVEKVAQHPARDRIRMTGKLPLSRVGEELSQLDVYLFPIDSGASTRSGTLPAALGSGLPVVATSAHETDLDLFRDGENIVFARELSGRAFAEAALRVLEDRSFASSVGKGARRLYDDHLTWERIVGHFLSEP